MSNGDLVLKSLSPSCRIITTELPRYSITKTGLHSYTLEPALPIENERNDQELKQKREEERDTRTEQDTENTLCEVILYKRACIRTDTRRIHLSLDPPSSIQE